MLFAARVMVLRSCCDAMWREHPPLLSFRGSPVLPISPIKSIYDSDALYLYENSGDKLIIAKK